MPHTGSGGQCGNRVRLVSAVLARILGFCASLIGSMLTLSYAKWVVHAGAGSQSRDSIGLVATVFTVNVSHCVVR